MPTGHLEGVFSAMMELQRRKESERDYALAKAREVIAGRQAEIQAEHAKRQHEEVMRRLDISEEQAGTNKEYKEGYLQLLQDKASDYTRKWQAEQGTKKEGLRVGLEKSLVPQYSPLSIPGIADYILSPKEGASPLASAQPSPEEARKQAESQSRNAFRDTQTETIKKGQEANLAYRRAMTLEAQERTKEIHHRSEAITKKLPHELAHMDADTALKKAEEKVKGQQFEELKQRVGHLKEVYRYAEDTNQFLSEVSAKTGLNLSGYYADTANHDRIGKVLNDLQGKYNKWRAELDTTVKNFTADSKAASEAYAVHKRWEGYYNQALNDPKHQVKIGGNIWTMADVAPEYQKASNNLTDATSLYSFHAAKKNMVQAEVDEAEHKYRAVKRAYEKWGGVKAVNPNTGRTDTKATKDMQSRSVGNPNETWQDRFHKERQRAGVEPARVAPPAGLTTRPIKPLSKMTTQELIELRKRRAQQR